MKKIISYSNFHQTFQIGSYFFRNTYGLVKKIFRAKKRTSIGLIFSHFRSIFLIFGLFLSPTENFVIFIGFTIYFCQTPDLDQDLSLGVDFVFPLEQEEEEEEEPPHQHLPEGC